MTTVLKDDVAPSPSRCPPRHSREGGNLGLSGGVWIPACAGMTRGGAGMTTLHTPPLHISAVLTTHLEQGIGDLAE